MSKKLRMFMDAKAVANSRGDWKLARAMDVEMARLGFRETTQAPVMEQAVPEQPMKRGRPPKPRCEHKMLLDRCPECAEEGMVD